MRAGAAAGGTIAAAGAAAFPAALIADQFPNHQAYNKKQYERYNHSCHEQNLLFGAFLCIGGENQAETRFLRRSM